MSDSTGRGKIFAPRTQLLDLAAAQVLEQRVNLSRDYTVRLLNETIARCEGQDIRNWKSERNITNG
jgi:hypothetical protein